jgi:hypothetical protein
MEDTPGEVIYTLERAAPRDKGVVSTGIANTGIAKFEPSAYFLVLLRKYFCPANSEAG